jgi:hypothetical protein
MAAGSGLADGRAVGWSDVESTGEQLMQASLVASRPGVLQPKLKFGSVQIAARTVLRFVEQGLAIPSIVGEDDSVIWDYPGGDPRSGPGRAAVERLRLLAGAARG